MRAMVLIAILSIFFGCTTYGLDSPYGQIVTFAEGQEVQYTDFLVRFEGIRREMSEAYGRDFVYYDFEIVSESESITASWTAGTGAIAPLPFSIDGHNYFLVLKINELKRQDYMLAENEMIIWPEDAYIRKLEGMR